MIFLIYLVQMYNVQCLFILIFHSVCLKEYFRFLSCWLSTVYYFYFSDWSFVGFQFSAFWMDLELFCAHLGGEDDAGKTKTDS